MWAEESQAACAVVAVVVVVVLLLLLLLWVELLVHSQKQRLNFEQHGGFQELQG